MRASFVLMRHSYYPDYRNMIANARATQHNAIAFDMANVAAAHADATTPTSITLIVGATRCAALLVYDCECGHPK